MKVLVLGIGSAVPTTKRNPSSQLLEVDNSYYLIDCGEGTQIRLRENRVRIQRIKCIFITHMHGDHTLGLMGLLWTMNLLGRTQSLKVFAPSPMKELIDLQNKISGGRFNFDLKFEAVDEIEGEVIYSDKKVEVKKFPLDHKIWCCGYRFDEQPKPRKLISSKIEEYDIPISLRKGIKAGSDFVLPSINKVIPNAELTEDPESSKSYAYCSDTKYNIDVVPYIEGVDLLYHESTFLEEDSDKAALRMHSTAKEAGRIAKEAKVKQLMLGHFSNRYRELNSFLEEANEIFKSVILGEEDKWIVIS